MFVDNFRIWFIIRFLDLAQIKTTFSGFSFFYEGNDLENNLHELEHRGFEHLQQNFNETEIKIKEIIAIEAKNLADKWSYLDHSAFYNIASGIFKTTNRNGLILTRKNI